MERLHPFNDDDVALCPYRDTLLPMAWLIRHDDKMAEFVVNSKLRKGAPLDVEGMPFEIWMTLTESPRLCNILELLMLFIDILGVPSFPMIHC